MAKKKKVKKPEPTYSISHCNITGPSYGNDHLNAIQTTAEALKENAAALGTLAKSLNMSSGKWVGIILGPDK